ncbi:MAG: hypothetical protein R3F22_00120 [Lysobacteraceae bacterium]
MIGRPLLLALMATSLLMAAFNAEAKRRATRVDAGSWSTESAFGSVDCPGSFPASGNVAAALRLEWGPFRFHGSGDTAYTAETYCQTTVPGLFSGADFEFLDPPEPALQTLVGANTDDAVTGIRYTWATSDGLFGGPSFQWTFFFFPDGITIVALYGMLDPNEFPPVPVVLDASTAIKQGTSDLWNAAGDSFDGEYFCFVGNEYAGLWNGELSDSGSACLAAGTIFAGGFE